MGYTEQYHKLKSVFNQASNIPIRMDKDIECASYSFHSTRTGWDDSLSLNTEPQSLQSFFAPDDSIPENDEFFYSVFYATKSQKFKKAILLLHGLNEKHWDKYLVWALHLSIYTGRPVILFPIAFHMNRTPEAWSNPRIMTPLLKIKNKQEGPANASTFVNLALSERLIANPLRFLNSGKQSAEDITRLLSMLNDGHHPLFDKGTTLDVFSYSIGTFLSQILFLANPKDLLSESKLFMFCGGSFFDTMDGVSKLIMDETAFARLRRYYIHDFNHEIKKLPKLSEYIHTNSLGKAFKAMLSGSNEESYREARFRSMRNRLYTIALQQDRIIHAKGIQEAMEPFTQVKLMDFPYQYSHENPFPVAHSETSHLVDQSFENIFNHAVTFFA